MSVPSSNRYAGCGIRLAAMCRRVASSPSEWCEARSAREAATLLDGTGPVTDVAHRAGFHDQSHMARSLRRFIGHTATELSTGAVGQMSVLYKTSPGDHE